MGENDLIISDGFRDKILRVFKDKGEAWLNKLPDLLKEFIDKWELADCRVEENLSVNFICYAKSPKHGKVALKAGVPHPELFRGIDALIHYGGKRACMLYEVDREQGMMLMKRIIPGIRLLDEPDFKQRIKVGTDLAANIPIPIHGQHDFLTYREHLEKTFEQARREKYAGEEFMSMLALAEDLYEEIQSLNRPKVLLHGDLHHENILLDASGNWKVIDPQGLIGEQCLEAGRFLLNEWGCFGEIGDFQIMSECIDSFAKALGESPRAIAISCFLDYAIVNCGILEDGEAPDDIHELIQPMMNLLELLKSL